MYEGVCTCACARMHTHTHLNDRDTDLGNKERQKSFLAFGIKCVHKKCLIEANGRNSRRSGEKESILLQRHKQLLRLEKLL